MAGMFYSLQEVAEKLNKTEEEIKQIVKKGKLREFRDGSNVLFKIDEIEALMSDTGVMASEEPSPPPVASPAPASPDASRGGGQREAAGEQRADESDISLAPQEDEQPAEEGELTDAVPGEGTSILGEVSSDTSLVEDTMAETKAASGEASLEEIEEDVSLDSFGSGSGLLDLSLQADDTSLGDILDEIYAPEGVEEQKAAGAGSAMEVATEAEQMLSEEQFAGSPLAPEMPVLARAYVEPEPDMLSNAFGIMLFLPLLAVIYTAIIVVAGFGNVMPKILTAIQGLTWYIMGGVAVAAILIIGIAFILTNKANKAGKKQKRVKKAPQPAPKEQTA